MRWADIAVATTSQAQDAVSNLMIENGCGGVAIQGEAPVVVNCFLPVNDQIEQRLLRIQTRIKELSTFGLDVGPGEISIKYAEEKDWAEAWKQFYHTIKVGRRIVIKPAWEEYEPSRDDVVVEVEPGMTFGTGLHATTRLCLEALEAHLRPGWNVVDFGTGSGILAMAAAKLGASLVIAFDADETAARVARQNVQRNDLEEFIEVHQTDKLDFITDQVDLVTANIISETIMTNADALARLLRTGGVLIASGITESKSLDVEQSLRNAGFDIADTLSEEEWVAVIARRAG